jgi:heme/copper-type cytochrome/quinol oxidase subunit 2
MRLLSIGTVFSAAGLLYGVIFVNVPYQDPTPEMQSRWEFDNMIASRTMLIGIAVMLAGCVGLVLRRLRASSKASQHN